MSHSKLLSPSASGIWLVGGCTAQPQALVDSGIENTDSPASLMGTWKHDLSEEMYLGLIDENDKPDDMDAFDWQEVITAVEVARDFLEDMEVTETELVVGFTEEWRTKDGFGTADLTGHNTTTRVVKIGDYKFGRVRVGAENNSQMMIYGRAFLAHLERQGINPATTFDTIEMAIIQPKVSHQASVFSMSIKDLLDWDQDTLAPAQQTILNGLGVFKTGEHCGTKYCPLATASMCPAANEKVAELMTEIIDSKDKQMPEALMMNLMEYGALIKKSIEAAWGIATSKLKGGEEVEGYKLVQGKGKRSWVSEESAAKYLKGKLPKEEVYTEKMITGPQAEVKLKQAGKLKATRSKNLFAEQMSWTEGATVIAPESDSREEVVVESMAELEMAYAKEEDKELDDLMNDFM